MYIWTFVKKAYFSLSLLGLVYFIIYGTCLQIATYIFVVLFVAGCVFIGVHEDYP